MPEFDKLAEAFGASGYRIDDYDDVAETIDAAIAYDGPSVIDVHIDPDANVYPMVPKRRRQRSVRTDGGPAMTSERATHFRCHAHRDATRVTVGQTASDCNRNTETAKPSRDVLHFVQRITGCFA